MNLVGFSELKQYLVDMVKNGDAYRRVNAQIPHFVINLKPENGQSFVANYITTVLFENKLRKFSGLDYLLEYKLDGSLHQLQQMFENVARNAIYSNEYEGVLAIDISELSNHVNEYQMDFFIEHLKPISQNATLIIYYDDSIGKKMNTIKARIMNNIGNTKSFDFIPYSKNDLTELVMQNIMERGIEISAPSQFEEALHGLLDRYHVDNIKQAVSMAENLMLFTDCNNLIPRIDANVIARYYRNAM